MSPAPKTAFLAAAFGLVLAAAGSGGARADLVQNGNFAAGFTDWTASGNIGLAEAGYYFGLGNNLAGTEMAVLNAGNVAANDSVSQILATVAGASYDLTFNYGSNGSAQSVTAALTDTGSATVLASQFDTANGSGTLAPYSLEFTAISASTTLSFTDYPGNNSFNSDGGLTDVSVPEPASLALLATGAGGLLLRRRGSR